ncbi:MAG TPA: uroporphyrinogen-III C-methyltransferase [Ktedonobacteraceae bacterium]|nr:uroporphyrinogen-III C-methyltransferase [Ktedonobacteraceae bacterium]
MSRVQNEVERQERREILPELPQMCQASSVRGKVYLVGAGPGDPDLITVKALRCLRAAQVVVYDRLANPALLDEVSEHTELIFVGKQSGKCALRQEEINALLVEQASLGKIVVRLKGGDPFVFGRGGEEALALATAGISFEVVPGISSAIAVPAYAGIPVTHRGESCAVTIVTGHEDPSRPSSLVNWDALAKLNGTLVILMGMATLSSICQKLLDGGMASTTPASVIEQGTIARQSQVTATLANIAECVATAGLHSPAVIVIGHVVDLGATLSWFSPLRATENRQG